MKISGNNSVISAIQNGNFGIVYISSHHHLLQKLKMFEQHKKCSIHIKPVLFFKQNNIRQNILLEVQQSITKSVESIKSWLNTYESKNIHDKNFLVLILDHIQDAQNFGAIFRSAALFSVDLIVVPNRRMAPINEFTIRGAAGTISSVPICSVSNLTTSINTLKKHDFWIYALDMEGNIIHNTSFSKRSAFILGSEGKGLSRLLKDNSDEVVCIPTSDVIDSLNVSVSNGIICYEYRKQFPIVSA